MNSLDKQYMPEFWVRNGFYETYKSYGGNETLSLREIFEHTDILATDKIWCATRRGVLTRSEMDAALEIVVTRAINNAKSLGISCNEWDAWAEKWLSGEDRSGSAANTAARAAECAAAEFYFSARAAYFAADNNNTIDDDIARAAYAAAHAHGSDACAEMAQQLRDIINVCDGGRNE